MRFHLVALTLTAALAACDPEASIGPRHTDAIREQEQAQMAAITAEDAAAAAAFYAPDAVVTHPFSPPETTTEAIQHGFQQLFDDPNGSLSFTPTNVIMPSSSDYAISEGTFAVTYTDPATNQRASSAGPYMTVWRRQDDDSWKIIRDMSTPGPMAPAEPPAAQP